MVLFLAGYTDELNSDKKPENIYSFEIPGYIVEIPYTDMTLEECSLRLDDYQDSAILKLKVNGDYNVHPVGDEYESYEIQIIKDEPADTVVIPRVKYAAEKYSADIGLLGSWDFKENESRDLYIIYTNLGEGKEFYTLPFVMTGLNIKLKGGGVGTYRPFLELDDVLKLHNDNITSNNIIRIERSGLPEEPGVLLEKSMYVASELSQEFRKHFGNGSIKSVLDEYIWSEEEADKLGKTAFRYSSEASSNRSFKIYIQWLIDRLERSQNSD